MQVKVVSIRGQLIFERGNLEIYCPVHRPKRLAASERPTSKYRPWLGVNFNSDAVAFAILTDQTNGPQSVGLGRFRSGPVRVWPSLLVGESRHQDLPLGAIFTGRSRWGDVSFASRINAAPEGEVKYRPLKVQIRYFRRQICINIFLTFVPEPS